MNWVGLITHYWERGERVHFYLFRSIDYWENGKMTTKSEGREKAWQVLMPVLSIAFSKNRSRPSQTTKGKYLNMCTPVWNSQFFYWILYTNKLTTPASLSSVVQCSCEKRLSQPWLPQWGYYLHHNLCRNPGVKLIFSSLKLFTPVSEIFEK